MTDQEWLLQQLQQWEAPPDAAKTEAAIRAAIDSQTHQQFAKRLSEALRSSPRPPTTLPFPPPR